MRMRMARQICGRVNGSAFLARLRRNPPTAASALLAAGAALACEWVMRIVVLRTWRVRPAIASR